jgi:hypothetical protein
MDAMERACKGEMGSHHMNAQRARGGMVLWIRVHRACAREREREETLKIPKDMKRLSLLASPLVEKAIQKLLFLRSNCSQYNFQKLQKDLGYDECCYYVCTRKQIKQRRRPGRARARARLLEICGWDSYITSAHGSPTRTDNSDVLVNVKLWKVPCVELGRPFGVFA